MCAIRASASLSSVTSNRMPCSQMTRPSPSPLRERPVADPHDAAVRPDHAVVGEVAAVAGEERVTLGLDRRPVVGMDHPHPRVGSARYSAAVTPRISSICGLT